MIKKKQLLYQLNYQLFDQLYFQIDWLDYNRLSVQLYLQLNMIKTQLKETVL